MNCKQNKIVVLSALLLLAAGAPVRAADLPSTLMDPYLRMHVSLAGDTMDGVAASAKALSQEAQKLGVQAKTVATTAAKLATANDIVNAMMAYAKATGATFGPDVNVAFCPMVKKPWLQKGQNITNPYFGKAMLTCGEIRKG
jgi:hypothetical protein